MFDTVRRYCDALSRRFEMIPADRKILLSKISNYIIGKKEAGQPIRLLYICTHNSRRSHFGQIWAKVAADYYQVSGVSTFSGGTEATAFNRNAIEALTRVGFDIKPISQNENPVCQVVYGDSRPPIECFSKVFDHKVNPQRGFAAIMTCGDADENCPFIPGAEIRVATTYEDPKLFDNSPQRIEKYDERCRQIALETLFVFSKVVKKA